MLLKCSYTTDISIKNYVGLSRNLNLKHHFHPYIRRGHLIVKQRGINCLKFMTFETIKKRIFLKVFYSLWSCSYLKLMGQLKCRYFRKHHILHLFKHVLLGLTLSFKLSLKETLKLIVLIFTIKQHQVKRKVYF